MIRNYRWAVFGVLTALLAVLSLLSLTHGAVNIPGQQVLEILANLLGWDTSIDVSAQYHYVVTELRAPRLVIAILVGAGLACSGTAIQGLFRNPLADPGLIGVSSGAALGAVSVIVLGSSYLSGWTEAVGQWALPVASFLGGIIVTIITYKIATRGGTTDIATLLLAGIAINAIAGAATGLLTFMADDAQLRSMTFWSLGSLAKANWQDLHVAGPLLIVSIALMPLFSKALNSFLLGEHVAGHLGFAVNWTKRGIVALSALAVGCAVAMTGVIGFIGLVIPHILRTLIGPDHRSLMPATMIAGASLLIGGDLIARVIVPPAELPIGIIMSIIGGPFFLFLLFSNKRRSMA